MCWTTTHAGQDNMHWLPLLYADFTANRACVLSLMRPKPEQLAVLGRLLEAPTDTEDQRVKNTAAVTRVIVALATTPEYYATLNQFLREHPHLLRNELSFLWKYQGLIDLENKIAHFHASLLELKRQSPAHPCSLSVDRSSLLDSLHMSLVHEELSSGCPQRNLLHGFEVCDSLTQRTFIDSACLRVARGSRWCSTTNMLSISFRIGVLPGGRRHDAWPEARVSGVAGR
eukprot:m.971999 g.971999  ORF g.971999 m.971999 type:complete len:229 (+) comp23927_c0_seq31:2598-3284(+)